MSKKKKPPVEERRPPATTQQASPSVKRAVKWISAAVLICALLSGLMTLAPVLAIDVGPPGDPSNPFSYPFIVSNKMIVPLFGVVIVCKEEGEFAGGERFNNNTGVSEETLSVMAPHRSTTAPCHRGFDIKAPLENGTVTIAVSYSPFLWPFKMSTIRQFKADMNADKQTIWLPQ